MGFNTPIGPGKFNAWLAYTHLLDHYLIPLPDEEKDSSAVKSGDSEEGPT